MKSILKCLLNSCICHIAGVYLGTTVFQTTDYLPVYIPEDKCADYAHVEAGTVVIDGNLDSEDQEHRLRFTLGHEG